MEYTTELLEPMWWINNLLGSVVVLAIVVELWLLSYIRRIPNVRTYIFILFAINIPIMVYATFTEEGLTLGTAALGLIMVVFAVIAFSGYNSE